MKTQIKNIFRTLLIASVVAGAVGCDKTDDLGNTEIPYAPYVLSLGISAGGGTTYYVVTTDDLMNGTIDAKGKGIEQNGFRDYEQGNRTVFSIGGLGVTSVAGLTRDRDGYLREEGDFVFDNSLRAFSQIDESTMLGVEIPDNAESGSKITFYSVDIDRIAIKSKTHADIAPLAELEWPSITGVCRSGDNVYVTYFGMNPKTFDTKFTDATYVAVYSYPDMVFKTIMTDTRTGPAGSWYAHNGIFNVESGDMYVMSNSSLANGFSQATKGAAFLRIPKGTTEFDSYFFDFEAKSGGLRPAHIKYIGNGLVFAEVSTLNPQTTADRWSDRALKCCIIDLNNQTITDINEIPVHYGNGGRRFAVLVDGGYVYMPITNSEGTYIYRVDPHTGTAVKGAKILTTFVAGFFRS